MRILILMRGAPGCGKTTWIEKNNLKQYALSADDIRLMCQSPVLNADGNTEISQSSNKEVWKMLFDILEIRLKKGEFTVIDATNSTSDELRRYRELGGKYRYRIYCVDLTSIPIEETKRRNAQREEYKKVPENVIDRMYGNFAIQKVPSGIEVIQPDELNKVWFKQIDLSDYKKIHHIGDVHGCNTALQTYLDENGGIKDDEFYIFTGDLVDRGLENAEVVKFILSIKERKNVLLLEGNHERWLNMWANDETTYSKEFENYTKSELNTKGISKKEVRILYRKLGQCAYYKYGENSYFVCHGGLSTLPKNISLISTSQMINGVGGYGDYQKIADSFFDTTDENTYQIFGHRNTEVSPISLNDRVYNLEGQVEFGGCLRCVQVDNDGIHCIETKNKVYKITEKFVPTTVEELLNSLRANRYITEKKFNGISSFNFTKQVFSNRIWNEQTTKARGLYIDTKEKKIVARSYNKFFNINERTETKLELLQHRFEFPVTAYVKENGFLGIVGYNKYYDDLLIATKSSLNSDHAMWLKDLIYETISAEKAEELKRYIEENNVSFVFECVDFNHDPHIIEYPENKLFLLDIVYNDMEFKKYEYADMCNIANRFGIAHKEKAEVFANWDEFTDWYDFVTQPEYEYNGKKIEGFVLEDNNGFMTKLKLHYYKFWKQMRSVAQEILKSGRIRKKSNIQTPLANEFYEWLKRVKDEEDLPQNICGLRNLFFENKSSE